MNFLLLLFALLQAGLLVWTFGDRAHNPARIWLLRLLLLGMCYDNIVQGVGVWFIDTPWYEGANVPRFVLHAAVLPFLTIFALSVMRDAGVALARRAGFFAFCWLFTVACLGWGLYHEVFLLQLGPRSVAGVVKLGSVSSLPPVATILTSALLLPMAALVWKCSGWRWFFLGSLFIFLVNGSTGGQPWAFLAGNFAELVFIVSLLATDHRFAAQP